MHWPDEIRTPQFDVLDGEPRISPEERDMARRLVDQLTTEFQPSRFEDRYRERIMDAVRRKVDGEEIRLVTPEQPEGTVVTDLMETLRAGVERERERRSA